VTEGVERRRWEARGRGGLRIGRSRPIVDADHGFMSQGGENAIGQAGGGIGHGIEMWGPVRLKVQKRACCVCRDAMVSKATRRCSIKNVRTRVY
jgi:hypothetical protein